MITVVVLIWLRLEEPEAFDEKPVVAVERFAVEDEEREDISDAFWVWDDGGALRVPDEAGRLFRLKKENIECLPTQLKLNVKTIAY